MQLTISLIRERRAPFSPAIVKRLIKNGVKVIVQPSNRRAYPMQVSQRHERVTEIIRQLNVIRNAFVSEILISQQQKLRRRYH